MGRLITPVPTKPRQADTPVLEAPEPKGAAAPTTPQMTGVQKEPPTERILKYIPAEVVAFYVAVLGVMDSLPEDKPGLKTAYWVALVLGLILAPLYVLKLGNWKKTVRWQAIWAAIAFLVWAYTLGGAFKQLSSFHQPWIGSFLLLAVTLVAGLFPPPKEENG
jgi:hypothetical protein